MKYKSQRRNKKGRSQSNETNDFNSVADEGDFSGTWDGAERGDADNTDGNGGEDNDADHDDDDSDGDDDDDDDDDYGLVAGGGQFTTL